MSAHASANAGIFGSPAPAVEELPDERTRVATAVAYLLAFGVAIPVAVVLGLLTLLDPTELPSEPANEPRQTAVHTSPAAGIAGAEMLP